MAEDKGLEIIKGNLAQEQDEGLDIIKQNLARPPAQGEIDGGVPTAATVDSSPSKVFRPDEELNWLQRLLKGAVQPKVYAEVSSAQAFDRAVLTPIADFAMANAKYLEFLDRPINALRVAAYRDIKALHRNPIKVFNRFRAGDVRFSDVQPFASGLVDGFRGKERKEWSNVRDVALFGPFENRVNNFVSRHPSLRLSKNAADFATNLAGDVLTDLLIAKGAITLAHRPAAFLAKKSPTLAKGFAKVAPKTYTRVFWDDIKLPDNAITKKGYGEWLQATIKKNAPKSSLDQFDNAMLNVIMGEESLYRLDDVTIAKGATGFRQTTPVVTMAEQSYLNRLRREKMDLIKTFNSQEDNIKVLNKNIDSEENAIKKVTDLEESKYLFHGSPEGRLDQIDVTRHTKTWEEGVGFYATESKEIAEQYAKGKTAVGARKEMARQGGDVTILRSKTDKILDMEAPVDEELWNGILEDFGLKDYYVITKDKVDETLDEALSLPYTRRAQTNKEAFTQLRQIYFDDMGEDGVYAINENLVDRGYGATKHIEGKKGLAHEVHVFIDPDAVEIVDNVPEETALKVLRKKQEKLYTAKEFLIEQMAENRTKLHNMDDLIGNFRAGDIDTLKVNRNIKEKYLEEYFKASNNPRMPKIMDDVAKKVSNRTKRTIEELSDDEFMAAFDYFEIAREAPSTFDTIPAWVGALTGEKFMTPAWQWFHRHKASAIHNVVEQADIDSVEHSARALGQWENALVDIYGDSALKDKELHKRLFWLANRDEKNDKGLRRYLAYMASHGYGEEMIRQDHELVNRYKEIVNEFRDMFVAQGKIGAKGKPKVIENYVFRFWDEALEATEDDMSEQSLRAFSDAFQWKAHTKIDVPILKHRLKNKDGYVEDLDRALKSYINYATWNGYMEPALESAEYMSKLSDNKDIIEYTRNWINYAVRGMPTKGEQQIEPFSEWLLDKVSFVNKVLPESMQIATSNRATKQLLTAWRRASLTGAIGYRGRPPLKNAAQTLLSTAIHGTKNDRWGFRSLFYKEGQDLLQHCHVRLNRFPMQTFNVRSFSALEKYGLKAFSAVDKWPNVSKTFNATLHWTVSRDKNKVNLVRKFGHFDDSDIRRSAETLNKAILAGELKWDVEFANYMTKLSQYSYRNYDLPRSLWGQLGKTMLQFGSWPMNYYYSYLPTLGHMALTGRGPMGIELSRWERLGLLRHVLWQSGLFFTGKSMGIDLSAHLPPSPSKTFPFFNLGGAAPQNMLALQAFGGVWKMGTAKGDAARAKEGAAELRNSLLFLPPLAMREVYSIGKGDKSPVEFLFKLEKPKKKSTGNRYRNMFKRPTFKYTPGY